MNNIIRNHARALVAILCISAPLTAFADSTFLLQLGSFDSEDKASAKWDDLKSKNKDVLSGLTLHVAEVSLPPDNNITYRTQAGPISSHEKAAALCATLTSRSIECNVVETALFTPKIAPDDAGATLAAMDNPTPPPAPAAMPTPLADIPPAPPAASVAEQPVTPPAAPAPKKPGFFSRLFGSSPKPTPPAPVPAPAPAAPVAPVAETVVPPVAVTPVAAEVPPPPAPLPPAPPMAPPPPPPPPLPESGHIASPFTAPPIVGIAAPSYAPKPGAVAEVHVAEAIRVPVGSAKHKHKVVAGLPAVHGLGGTPSENAHKTFWAQMSYFDSEESARSFYAEFQENYPQFSDGVRVRVTHPYSKQEEDKVSLRVGPFASITAVRTICTAAAKQGLRCGSIREISSYSSVSKAHRAPAPKPIGAYEEHAGDAAATPTASLGSYWIQLGSFADSDTAWDYWKSLKEDNSKTLKRVQASVAMPPKSSAGNSLFRLRAGPFASESAADAICSKLGDTNCIVVNDQ